ncbi:MAG: sigma-70 family RNA polymerase sigma factor [Culicoidibacterales bacterium]
MSNQEIIPYELKDSINEYAKMQKNVITHEQISDEIKIFEEIDPIAVMKYLIANQINTVESLEEPTDVEECTGDMDPAFYARAVEVCSKDFERFGVLTQAEEAELIKIIVGDDSVQSEFAKHRLAEGNSHLVVSIAKRYVGRGILQLDLIHFGKIGLIKAMETFDYHRDFEFSLYAIWSIRQEIIHAIAKYANN